MTTSSLLEFAPGRIWVAEYPVQYSGLSFYSRMTLIRLNDGRVVVHSPCEIADGVKEKIESIGEVAAIVAPGSYHYFHVESAQQAFPDAETFICPGVELKRPDLKFDWILGDRPPPIWSGELEQVLIRGSRYMQETAFMHVPSKTLILVDLIENIGDQTAGAGPGLKIWWKYVFHMWNKAKPAPEYQLGWKDKQAARLSLERIMTWEFERVILAHGDLIDRDSKTILREAWANPLSDTKEGGKG